MAYRKREPKEVKCAHCNTLFTSNHKSKIYCCQSCNTLAWIKRNEIVHDSKAKSAKSLDFNFQNVGVVAAGSLIGSAGNDMIQSLFKKEVGQLNERLTEQLNDVSDKMESFTDVLLNPLQRKKMKELVKTKKQQRIDEPKIEAAKNRKAMAEAFMKPEDKSVAAKKRLEQVLGRA